uniref:BHLH domain-containing protein n=1 Tax=Cynoglossus semilaevis TaxID=244447 RepID=A0A3P8X468_CYNSE
MDTAHQTSVEKKFGDFSSEIQKASSCPLSLSEDHLSQFSMNTSFPPPITENRSHLGVPPPAGFIEGHAVSQQLLFCSSSIDTTGLTLYRGPAPTLLPYLTQFTNRHGHLTVYECPYEPAFIQKRNERERQRVKCVNQGYAKLRQHLPGQNADKRLSKVETLRAAISYIKYLQSLVRSASDSCSLSEPDESSSSSSEELDSSDEPSLSKPSSSSSSSSSLESLLSDWVLLSSSSSLQGQPMMKAIALF